MTRKDTSVSPFHAYKGRSTRGEKGLELERRSTPMSLSMAVGSGGVVLEFREKDLLRALMLWVGLCVMGCATSGEGTHSTQAGPSGVPTSHLLLIQDARDGAISHTWVLIDDSDWWRNDSAGGSQGELDSRIIFASGRQRDCNQEHHECYQRCKRRKPPYPYEYKRPSHTTYCRETCQAEYMECLKATGQHPMEFLGTNEAIEWLKRHRTELLVGAVIVVAGVTFVVVSAGAGVLILAPLAII